MIFRKLKWSIESYRRFQDYSRYQKQNLPIGSGITEAACKVIVKQRLCKSGMKWKKQGAESILNLRSISYSSGKWKELWSKIDKYGFQSFTSN